MPRYDGNTRNKNRKKHGGHKMHKLGRAARRARAKVRKRANDYAQTQQAWRDSAAAEAA